MNNFYLKNKKILNSILIVIFCICLLGIAKVCYADPIDAVITTVLGWIANIIVSVCGWVLSNVIAAVIDIAQYNNFIDNQQIIEAWTIIRDLCNMFFVLIVLVIAFATILKYENYHVKKLLPKLIIMAILINFSKMICGLLIDFSQVIMLTFVNAFTDSGGNFISLLKVQDYLSIAKNTGAWNVDDSIDLRNTVLGIIIAVLFMIIATIAMIAILIVFVMRVIMLWIYVILSPLAFLLSAFPAGMKYASQYWGQFTKYLLNGPVLAFFIWLALITMSGLDVNSFTKVFTGAPIEMLQPTSFMHFIIAIGMLVGGLMVTQQIGGIGASWGAGAVRGIGSKGAAWARKSAFGVAKLGGKTAAYLPKEYGKRAGYGVADMLLGAGKRMPIISGLAMKKQAELRMKREYAEEKDARYVKYLSEPDLDRVIRNYSGEGRTRPGRAVSFLTRGQEASRQGYKRAWSEKMQRGDEWGQEIPDKKRNKTRALIELAQLAGHSVTSSGEDTFRDADLGKQWHEFRKKNVGMIDDDEMRAYYLGGVGTSGRRYDGLAGGDNSEYWRGPDPATGEARSPNSMVAYTASRLSAPELVGLHHENLAIDPTTGTNAVLDAAWGPARAASKKVANVWDRGTAQVQSAARLWADANEGFNEIFGNRGALTPAERAAEVQENYGLVGRSRMAKGESKSPEIASGITGLDKLEKGRLALNFSDIKLDSRASGKIFEAAEKAEVASRIGNKLRQDGMAENLAKAVEEQINKTSYLILHNKEAKMDEGERRTTHAHEIMHARLSSTFSDDELKGVWQSIPEENREQARQKVKKKWKDDKLSDDTVMHEYFAEGLTNKTKWKEKNLEERITLDQETESKIDNLLKSNKGSNIQAFTSNITETRPTRDNTKQAMINAVDPRLQKSMEDLATAIESMGDGLDSISKASGSTGDLEKSVYRNNILLEKNIEAYKDNSGRLNNLVSKIS